MSKNPIIQIDGTPETFEDTPRIRTDGLGVGRIGWIPEDETRTGGIIINKNGEYTASSKGVYGFSKAVVRVPADSVTGKKPDGNDYTISIDGSGNIVETKVPTEIRVTTPPNYTGPYGDHAYISFTGLVVTAYDGNGQVMQEVPFEELVFPVTEAHYDPEEPLYTEGYIGPLVNGDVKTTHITRVTLMGEDIQRPSQPVWDHSFDAYDGYEKMAYYGYRPLGQLQDLPEGGFTVSVFYASSEQVREGDRLYTYDGKTVYINSQMSAGGNHHKWTIEPYPPEREHPECNISDFEAALGWTMIYGTPTGTSGGYQVPVQWPRTGDGLMLETSFAISVVPGPGTNDGN